MKKLLFLICGLLFTSSVFAQTNFGIGGVRGIRIEGLNLVVYSESGLDSFIVELPSRFSATVTMTTLIQTILKLYDADLDSITLNPAGFDASDQDATGNLAFQIKDGGTNLFSVDTLGLFIGAGAGATLNNTLADSLDITGELTATTIVTTGSITDGTYTSDGVGNFTGIAALTTTGLITIGGLIDGNGTGATTNNTLADSLGITGNVSATTYGSDGSVTDAELLYINTVSSNVQDQIDAISLTPTVTIDGNKTSDTLLVVVNDNDGAVGDSAFVVLPSGLIRGIGSAIDANNTFADTLELTGALELPDEQSVTFGGASDWKVYFDDDVDDQLIFETTVTTSTSDQDPLLLFLFPTNPDANQHLFGISKGTQASLTGLFTIDEDGDMQTQTGIWRQTGGVNNTIELAAGLFQTDAVNMKIDPDLGSVGILQLGDTGDNDTTRVVGYFDVSDKSEFAGDLETLAYNRKATILYQECFDNYVALQDYLDHWDASTLNVSGTGTNELTTNVSHITLTTDGVGNDETEGTKSILAFVLRADKPRGVFHVELSQTTTTNFYCGWNTQATNTVVADDAFVLWVYEVGQANWQLWIDNGAGGSIDKYVSDVAVSTADTELEISVIADGTVRAWINGTEKTHGLTELMTATGHFLIVGQIQTTDASVVVAEIDWVEWEKYK